MTAKKTAPEFEQGRYLADQIRRIANDLEKPQVLPRLEYLAADLRSLANLADPDHNP